MTNDNFNKDDYYFTNDSTLRKHRDIISKMEKERVFSIQRYQHNGRYNISEACDNWFNIDLSKEDCLQLAELFKDLAEVIID